MAVRRQVNKLLGVCSTADGRRIQGLRADLLIDDWTSVDLQYTYNLELSASEVVVTRGVKNAFH